MLAQHRLLLIAVLATGCTFGVDAVEVRREASIDAAGITLLREDISHVDGVRLTGRDDSTIAASLVTRGLIPPGQEEAARESIQLELHVDGSVAGLTTSASGPLAELLEPGRLELDVPTEFDVDLELGSASAHVSDVGGQLRIRGGSGSVELDGGGAIDIELASGSIIAEARSAVVHTASGSMDLEVSEHVSAKASSGSIHVRLAGGGGELYADDGSIQVWIDGPLSEDLEVSANDGSVRVHLAPGVGVRLDLSAGNGSVAVDVEGEHEGRNFFVGVIGGGGPTVRVRTGDGSIVVDTASVER